MTECIVGDRCDNIPSAVAAASNISGSGQRPRRFLRGVVTLAVLITLNACNRPRDTLSYLDSRTISEPYKFVEIRPVKDGSSRPIAREILNHTRDRLQQRLEKAGFVVLGNEHEAPTSHVLLVVPTIRRFDAGSSAKRVGSATLSALLLAPIAILSGAPVVAVPVAGVGACVLEIHLLDGRTREEVGDVGSSQTNANSLLGNGASLMDTCVDSAVDAITHELKPSGGRE